MIVFLPGCDVIDFEMNLVFLHDQNVKAKIQISWDRNKLLRSDKKHISSFLRGIIEVKKILLELFFLLKKDSTAVACIFPELFRLLLNFKFLILTLSSSLTPANDIFENGYLNLIYSKSWRSPKQILLGDLTDVKEGHIQNPFKDLRWCVL